MCICGRTKNEHNKSRGRCSFRGVRSDVWIDDIRLSGTRGRVSTAIEVVEARAKYCGATFKKPMQPLHCYDFIGVRFDCNKHTVAVARKTLAKLPRHIDKEMSAADIEALVSRLIWCDGVLRIPLACHYFALKWSTRLCNALNRGTKAFHQRIVIPDSTLTELIRWKAAAMGSRRISARQQQQQQQQRKRSKFSADSPDTDFDATLYVDASLKGCGAVFTDGDCHHSVAGEAWSESMPDADKLQSGDISRLEARATAFGVEKFSANILNTRRLLIRIDNTSVVAAMRSMSGHAKADSLNQELAETLRWLWDSNVDYVVRYVKSAENIADSASRNF